MDTSREIRVCSQHHEFSNSIGHMQEAVGELKDSMDKTYTMIAENRDMVSGYMNRQEGLCKRMGKMLEGNGEKPLAVRLGSLESGVRLLEESKNKSGDRTFSILLAVGRWAFPGILFLIALAIANGWLHISDDITPPAPHSHVA